MTYQDLFEQLARMTPEQLKCNLTVELALSEEILSSVEEHKNNKEVRFDIAVLEEGVDHETLDENHPVIVVQW